MFRCVRLVFVVFAFFMSVAANADVLDRIDRCESIGGSNGCVYDLLRKLANGGGGLNPDNIVTYCRCEQRGRDYESNLMVYTENVTNNTVESRSLVMFRHDSDNRRCLSELANHPRCNVR